MIAKPELYIEDFINAGCDIITFHCEAVTHIDRLIDYIKSFGVKVGIALNPSTSEESLRYIIEKLDLILVMTVNPGFSGQDFLFSQLTKVKNIRNMINEVGKDILLEVDGGINDKTISLVKDAGANMAVSGSYIFSGDYKLKINSLKL